MNLLCRLFGHKPPPSPLDRIARVLGSGYAPCARCGESVFLKTRTKGRR